MPCTIMAFGEAQMEPGKSSARLRVALELRLAAVGADKLLGHAVELTRS